MLDCGPGDIRKQEATIPHASDASPAVRSGYWILRRMAYLEDCFIVFADDARVLHNIRYKFPTDLKNALTSMARDLERSGPA